ncbi:BT4734/BF3469 family protein [Flavobacterium sp.]|uniref:BT4734/BF3469 family protein n=1 Tax=Flavobacterium sp. TaxID=239 RepID=UPI00374D75FF
MVTIFKNFNEVVEHKSLLTILDEIKTGKYKPGIVYLRKSLAENKTEAYNKAKKSLPAFTPSAKFVGGRKLEFLAEYSKCIILDIDKLNEKELQNATHLANQSEFTFVSFISPSGNGFKILVKISSDKANHKEAFLLVQAYYESILKLEIDKSGKDVTRLCFYSFDENLYLNENAKTFVTLSEVEMQTSYCSSTPLRVTQSIF